MVTTIQKLGSLLNHAMQKISQKGPTSAAYWANKCLWAGKGGSKKSPLKVRKWLEEPEVKLSGRVYKAVKDKKRQWS